MMKFKKNNFDHYVPAFLQQPVKRFFMWPFRRLMIFVKDRWLPIYRIERSGLTVILIGHEACDPFSDKACDPYIIALLYGEYIEPIRIGVVPFWSLNRAMRRWEKKSDLIIFRHKRFRPEGAVTSRMLNMPHHVTQIINLPPSDADLLTAFHNAQTREDLRRIRKADFQYEMTQDPAHLDFFYHQMYLPYIEDRHRGSARCIPWEAFRKIYAKAELMLIHKAGIPVAGNLSLQTGDCFTGHVLGVLNADRELIKSGAIASCYWFSIVEAHRRGCTTVDMQYARPFLNDGVLAYKRKWDSRVVADHIDPELWLLPCGKSSALHRFLEENPFICEQDGRLVSLIFLGSHVVLSDKELFSYLRERHYQGERLSTCVVLLSHEWAVRAETIQNILKQLPTSSHILNLSQGSVTELPALIGSWHERSQDASTEFLEFAYSQ